MLPYTLEAFGLLTHLDCVEITQGGTFKLRSRRISPKSEGTEEVVQCQQGAKILGRQFARLKDRVTIYASLGIRP
jgi:hypothetical protein